MITIPFTTWPLPWRFWSAPYGTCCVTLPQRVLLDFSGAHLRRSSHALIIETLYWPATDPPLPADLAGQRVTLSANHIPPLQLRIRRWGWRSTADSRNWQQAYYGVFFAGDIIYPLRSIQLR